MSELRENEIPNEAPAPFPKRGLPWTRWIAPGAAGLAAALVLGSFFLPWYTLGIDLGSPFGMTNVVQIRQSGFQGATGDFTLGTPDAGAIAATGLDLERAHMPLWVVPMMTFLALGLSGVHLANRARGVVPPFAASLAGLAALGVFAFYAVDGVGVEKAYFDARGELVEARDRAPNKFERELAHARVLAFEHQVGITRHPAMAVALFALIGVVVASSIAMMQVLSARKASGGRRRPARRRRARDVSGRDQ